MEEQVEVTVEATDAQEPVAVEQLGLEDVTPAPDPDEARKLAVLEAIVYVTDEPLTAVQTAGAMAEAVALRPLRVGAIQADQNRCEQIGRDASSRAATARGFGAFV